MRGTMRGRTACSIVPCVPDANAAIHCLSGGWVDYSLEETAMYARPAHGARWGVWLNGTTTPNNQRRFSGSRR